MNRSMRIMRSLAAVVITSLLFMACVKSDRNDYLQQPAAGLMAFNLAADKPTVGFTLSGNSLGNTAIKYTGYTGVYLPIYVGNREVRSFDHFTGNTLAIANGSFADSMYYSAFLIGANGNYRNLVVKDELAPLTAVPGKAWVRYVNAIPDSTVSPTVTIGEGINETGPYARVSSFAQVNVGSVNLSVNNGNNISANRTITIEENKVYTVLFVGIPGSTDPDKAVQIRFIQNGTVTH
jgi:hypothetical protein